MVRNVKPPGKHRCPKWTIGEPGAMKPSDSLRGYYFGYTRPAYAVGPPGAGGEPERPTPNT